MSRWRSSVAVGILACSTAGASGCTPAVWGELAIGRNSEGHLTAVLVVCSGSIDTITVSGWSGDDVIAAAASSPVTEGTVEVDLESSGDGWEVTVQHELDPDRSYSVAAWNSDNPGTLSTGFLGPAFDRPRDTYVAGPDLTVGKLADLGPDEVIAPTTPDTVHVVPRSQFVADACG